VTAAQTSDGRLLIACDHQCPERPTGWTMSRRPKCNRVSGHDGPHQERRARDFAVKAEWS
jgi:hypothetical protein